MSEENYGSLMSNSGHNWACDIDDEVVRLFSGTFPCSPSFYWDVDSALCCSVSSNSGINSMYVSIVFTSLLILKGLSCLLKTFISLVLNIPFAQ